MKTTNMTFTEALHIAKKMNVPMGRRRYADPDTDFYTHLKVVNNILVGVYYESTNCYGHNIEQHTAGDEDYTTSIGLLVEDYLATDWYIVGGGE